jgi:predicted dithiol-disulfide oxidoreductase (DUF899 family)
MTSNEIKTSLDYVQTRLDMLKEKIELVKKMKKITNDKFILKQKKNKQEEIIHS